jgi:hypothetical protein
LKRCKTMKRILFIAFISTAAAQNSVGFIDRDSAMKLIPEYLEYQGILQREVKMYEDSMNIYYDLYSNLMSQAHFNDTTKLRQLEKKVNEFQNAAQFQMVILEDSLKSRLTSLINLHASKFCTLHNIDMLADKNAVLHCIQCKDWMAEFVRFLRTQK